MISITEGNYPVFSLHTAHTTYAFRVLETGHLQHLYYGKRIHVDPYSLGALLSFAGGNTTVYDDAHKNLSLEQVMLEMSGHGKGDYREPFVELIHADGGRTSDFLYASYEVSDGKINAKTLPGSYGTAEQVQTLAVTLRCKNYGDLLTLYYHVYEDCDVICRRCVLSNEGEEALRINRLLSTQIDLPDHEYVFTSFHGAWTREMGRVDQCMEGGSAVNHSATGTSSNRSNPFVMLSRPDTTEESGECFGLNLIYSANHYECSEVSGFGQLRFVSGIDPLGFSYLLESGESFETPEAVMTFSDCGWTDMSHHMHAFVRNHIVRGTWQYQERPILLNSWEAQYFDIDEKKLLNLAKKAKDVGIELFVMDDGWFGKRNDDTSSLGDWTVNTEKLPGGLSGLIKKITDLGLKFGIWVEPEMVNVDSELYRVHPDWVIDLPDCAHSEGRNQRILDLINPDVQEYIIEAMSRIFETDGISYVKWDMNRNFSDVYSRCLPPERQGEVSHRYVMGLYHVMDVLTKRFPEILFEGCASGGNRFDLGILCYFPQIWASDNTDAYCRLKMMDHYSLGYPMSVVSAHVSGVPNHQTLRRTTLNTRFHVASFGVLGYEFNLGDLPKETLEKIAGQIALYKEHRHLMQYGTFYRKKLPNRVEWMVVSENQKDAVCMLMHEHNVPNDMPYRFYAMGLEEETRYRFYNVPVKHHIEAFGDLVNTVSPVHLKQGSLLMHMASRFVKLDGETEEFECYGDLLMHAGVLLKQSYSGVGFSDQVAYLPDFGSRMYFVEEAADASTLEME